MEVTAQPPFTDGRPVLLTAFEWAAQLHASQQRDVDQAPYITHPLEVAALLHDVVEKSEAGVEDVRERFGDRIAGTVAALSEDDEIADFEERKAALRASVAAGGSDAQLVYAADKIAKARELRAQLTYSAASLDDPVLRRRYEHYVESLEMLTEVGGDLPILEALAFELWALRHLPPA